MLRIAFVVAFVVLKLGAREVTTILTPTLLLATLKVMFEFSLSYGQIKVMSAVLSNLAAAWLGSLVIFPGIFGLRSFNEFLVLLTYSLFFATLSVLAAAKLEDKYL